MSRACLRGKVPAGAEGSFCPVPFAQLELQPTGNISPCCWLERVKLGNARTHSLEEAWNSPRLRAIRREFLAGEPRTCRRRMREVGCHRLFEQLLDKVALTEVQERPPLRYDLRLNGRCSLKCRMCRVWKQPSGAWDGSWFWVEGPQALFPAVMEMDVLGGEPFIQDDTFRLIDAVAAVSPGCTWAFSTNAAYAFSPRLTDALDKVRIRWLQVSLDAVEPATYAAIRRGGSLERTLGCLDAFIAYRDRRAAAGDGFTLMVSMCVQKANWAEIPAFLRFARERELHPLLQYAFGPMPLSLTALPVREQRRVAAFLEEHVPPADHLAVAPILDPLKAFLRRPLHHVLARLYAFARRASRA
ncbi:MAG: SPASM domain-containing protein [Acidobacteria bacterium]|nr:SPASM domain-containing protein [Acidobacteriota bacterium]